MKRQWLGFALAFLLAALTSFGTGYWAKARNDPQPSAWLRPGEILLIRGSEFTIRAFGTIDNPSDYYTPPEGAVLLRLELGQRIVTAPDDLNELICDLTLHTERASWRAETGLTPTLDAKYTCKPDEDETSSERVVAAVWAVPPGILDEPHWVEVDMGYPRETFGVRP